MILKKTFPRWWIIHFLGKMLNVQKHRDLTLVTTEKRINYLVSEPNYYTTKFFIENLLAKEIRKTQILTKKSVYLGLWILDLSKTVMYEFWYDYVKPKYDDKAKLCYMDTESFIAHLKTNFYKDIAQDVKIKFDTSNYKLKGLLPKGRKLLV